MILQANHRARLSGNNMDKINITGGCQCGNVRFRVNQTLENSHICHCRMCQKAVGNVFICLASAKKENVSWTRGNPSAWQSSAHVKRGFCNNCGTPLFYDDITSDDIAFTIGSLDKPSQFVPIFQSGLEGKMPWLDDMGKIKSHGITGTNNDKEWADAIKISNNQHPDYDVEN